MWLLASFLIHIGLLTKKKEKDNDVGRLILKYFDLVFQVDFDSRLIDACS